jgi:transposase
MQYDILILQLIYIVKNYFKMRSTVAIREALRERVKNLIPQMNKSEIVHHFVKEGIARSTVYDAINRMENDQPIKDNKRTGRPTSWTTQKKNRLKRLVNNRTGVSQRRLGKKFGLHQTTIGRQLAKMRIQYRKREKTPKYDHNQLQKAED